MGTFMEYFNAFWVGGLICALCQILLDRTKMLPGRIMVTLVCTGAVLSFLGLYDPFAEYAGAGASVPLRFCFFLRHFFYYIIPPASAQFFTCYFFIFGWKIQLARYAKINAADVPTAPAFNPPWNNPKNPLSFTASFTP